MRKTLLTLALAGAVALPFAAGGHADAQTKDNTKTDGASHYHVYINNQVKNMSLEDLEKFLKNTKGQNIQKLIQQYGINVNHNDEQTQQKPSTQTKPAAPAKGTQTQKPTASSQQATDNGETTKSVSAYEQQVVDLTNKERTDRGLQPLKLDVNLSKMARDKSADMVKNNYFDHQSPTYGSPFDMMKKYGISYSSAGENIAAGQKTPEEVVNSWMNSEGHRANILNPDYDTIGVGYVQGGSYGSYWTQEFIGH
ncbi:putative YkwD family protein [Pullulanibacillus pueri]|uniref:SCP domain-containing protein n=1 Tax=Pullulanibacillus pueri TaxID=1437324 RepID=A0A8J2ZVU3_9BACL|nr:CAP domain-containing protein [Pullulanibacillus pueri]MBM7682303.1 putative YkwD family protein [Pullulanibacillus pueri]GGH80874.1 hypothetical protein GCM10007096_17930 [Pullulanibacillus pueri]